MKSNHASDVFATVIKGLGISAEEKPSVKTPIAVNLLYSNYPDGSVHCKWSKNEWIGKFHRLLHGLGWQNALRDNLVLYTDVPTATFLQMKWKENKMITFQGTTYFH